MQWETSVPLSKSKCVKIIHIEGGLVFLEFHSRIHKITVSAAEWLNLVKQENLKVKLDNLINDQAPFKIVASEGKWNFQIFSSHRQLDHPNQLYFPFYQDPQQQNEVKRDTAARQQEKDEGSIRKKRRRTIKRQSPCVIIQEKLPWVDQYGASILLSFREIVNLRLNYDKISGILENCLGKPLLFSPPATVSIVDDQPPPPTHFSNAQDEEHCNCKICQLLLI